MKVMIPLLAVALLLLGSVNASAVLCKHCHVPTDECRTVHFAAAASCDYSEGFCEPVGQCPSAQAAELPLASQYTIASVERLDGQRSITAPQTARLATKPAPKH